MKVTYNEVRYAFFVNILKCLNNIFEKTNRIYMFIGTNNGLMNFNNQILQLRIIFNSETTYQQQRQNRLIFLRHLKLLQIKIRQIGLRNI